MTDGGLLATRQELHRVAVHVLGRRRHAVTGRFGLRATPGGFGTPAFGPPDEVEVVRVAGAVLVHEVGGDVRTMPIGGSSLADLADLAGADLTGAFDAGPETPGLGGPTDPLVVAEGAARDLARWFDVGWQALDVVTAGVDGATTIQLWPEHFDAGCSVPVGPRPDDRANLGASPGDAFSAEPYLYVGPWGLQRPGDDTYWNAPFGATVGWDAAASVAEAVEFLRQGLERLRADEGAASA